jgi:glucose dehydrogenase
VPGERTAPTQRVPTLPRPFDRQGFTGADLIDFSPALRAEALEAVEHFRLGPLFAPASLADAKGTLVMRGTLGGANWEGGSYDPVSRTLFVGSMTVPSVYALAKDPNSEVNYSGLGRLPRVQGLPLVKPPWALLLATSTLLFSGEGWSGSPVFQAHDTETGEIVAEIEIPASMTGLPMTYMVDGRQYIVFAVGDADTPGELVALTLPE